jgi:hypothetical protein
MAAMALLLHRYCYPAGTAGMLLLLLPPPLPSATAVVVGAEARLCGSRNSILTPGAAQTPACA